MNECLIVGIDLGTTFTTVAHGFDRKATKTHRSTGSKQIANDQVNIFTRWPDQDDPFLPSLVAYPRKTPDQKNDMPIRWGLDAASLTPDERQNHDTVAYAKAQVRECAENTSLLISGNDRRSRERSRSEQPIRDLLERIRQHLLSELFKLYPSKMADPKLEIQYILGVPPAWELSEQLHFMDLAEQAGMPEARRVSEPEAMARQYFSRDPSLRVSQAGASASLDSSRVDQGDRYHH